MGQVATSSFRLTGLLISTEKRFISFSFSFWYLFLDCSFTNFHSHPYRIPTLSSSTPVSSKMKTSSLTTIAALALMQDRRGAHTSTTNKSYITRLIFTSLGIRFIPMCFAHAFDVATIRNFEKGIYAGYRWLANNYKPGDKIFLFGMISHRALE